LSIIPFYISNNLQSLQKICETLRTLRSRSSLISSSMRLRSVLLLSRSSLSASSRPVASELLATSRLFYRNTTYTTLINISSYIYLNIHTAFNLLVMSWDLFVLGSDVNLTRQSHHGPPMMQSLVGCHVVTLKTLVVPSLLLSFSGLVARRDGGGRKTQCWSHDHNIAKV